MPGDERADPDEHGGVSVVMNDEVEFKTFEIAGAGRDVVARLKGD